MNVAVLGSTGSIGQNALEVIKNFPGRFCVSGLSADSNIELLRKQIREFNPLFVGIRDPQAAKKLKAELPPRIKIFTGPDGLGLLVKEKKIEKILLAISGSAALEPLLGAIDSGKQIALANKEALVMAGPIIMRRATERKVSILPIDSEQSAIWQCLEGGRDLQLKNIYLTASGGPLREASRKEIKNIGIAQVLRHPRWKMGRKVTVDSATLMNKGLELLEAMFLFNVSPSRIKILVHPEAIIHSMVEFVDGVVLAQLSATDMRIPIQYALSYPERLANSLPAVDFYRLKELHFEKPDFEKFPCLGLAYRAAEELGIMPAILNAANEVSVEGFLKKQLKFSLIPRVIQKVMDKSRNIIEPGLNDILEADSWARRETTEIMGRLGG